ERFHREAHAIASLEQANILPVYDFGEQEGLLYLVMRLVRGGTVKDRFAREGSRPWPPERVLHVAQQILPALDYAHRAGVIHRDIKPANILLEDDWAYLADFGIAKLAAGAGVAPALTLTAAGMMVGTPSYMAPEQVRGQPLDGRADLYAFGVVVYELLTGHVPFHGDTPLEVAIHHLETPLPAARTMNPSVPVPVEAVLVRALAKDREERYPEGTAFLAALTGAIANSHASQPALPAAEGQVPQVTQA